MEPIDLPLLPTGEENTFIVLLPGLNRSKLKKCEYEVDDENEILKISCLYGGLKEDGEINGVTYPIQLNENKKDQIKNLRKIYPMNPLEVNLESYFEPEQADEMRRFFKQLENKYGDLPNEND